jgi:hypothetical protein
MKNGSKTLRWLRHMDIKVLDLDTIEMLKKDYALDNKVRMLQMLLKVC